MGKLMTERFCNPWGSGRLGWRRRAAPAWQTEPFQPTAHSPSSTHPGASSGRPLRPSALAVFVSVFYVRFWSAVPVSVCSIHIRLRCPYPPAVIVSACCVVSICWICSRLLCPCICLLCPWIRLLCPCICLLCLCIHLLCPYPSAVSVSVCC